MNSCISAVRDDELQLWPCFRPYISYNSYLGQWTRPNPVCILMKTTRSKNTESTRTAKRLNGHACGKFHAKNYWTRILLQANVLITAAETYMARNEI
jgi:hypothetical protein